jgi:RNA recognition motif-containing protein
MLQQDSSAAAAADVPARVHRIFNISCRIIYVRNLPFSISSEEVKYPPCSHAATAAA